MQKEKGITENWKILIENKIVVLFNTSISNLLNNEDQHINKIKQVLDFFQKQSEAILWWRPHPLELCTAEVMRPQLAKEYRNIQDNYRKAGWGIMDTSANLHRAISISDGYYGDWSSVVDLYAITQKPILYKNDRCSSTQENMEQIGFYKSSAEQISFREKENDNIFSLKNYVNYLGQISLSQENKHKVTLQPSGKRIHSIIKITI